MRKTLTRATPLCRLSFSSPSSSSLRSHILLLHSLVAEYPRAKRATVSFSSDPSRLPHYSSWRSQHDDDSRTVKVSVWWDFENCSVPAGVNVFLVAQRITSALRANGIKGPVTINAFGDVSQLSRAKQEALASTGISLTHVPNSGKNSADRSLLVDLIHWATQNPPPAHLFLISGDRDFANVLHRLRMSNYNILLASTVGALGVLSSAASIMWQWNGIVRGENLIGRHFNYPPDGSYASWYGHYKGPLEDPFASAELEEFLEQPRSIPKTLVNRIRQMLTSYPDGITISLLRQELEKSNVAIDKDFFGYKKFSKFLLALPNVLKVEQNPAGEGPPLVYGFHVKASEGQSGLKPPYHVENCNGWKDNCSSFEGQPSISEEKPKMCQPVEIHSKPPISASSTIRGEDGPIHLDIRGSGSTTKSCQLKQEEVPSPKLEEVEVQPEILVEEGTFRKMWRTWFGCKSHNSHENVNDFGKGDRIQLENEKVDTNEKGVNEKALNLADASAASSNSSSSKDLGMDVGISQSFDEKPTSSAGFYNWVVRSFKLWKSRGDRGDQNVLYIDKTLEGANTNTIQGQKHVKKTNSQSENQELFSNNYFWDDLESFLCTAKGFALVSRSRSRDQLAQELQKEGPLILKPLNPHCLSRLIDMLIIEKKWVEEYSSLFFPFKLVLPSKRKCTTPNMSNGLSSIFSSKLSNSSLGGNLIGKPPQNLIELKSWLNKNQHGAAVIKVEDVNIQFESEFNKKLDCVFYGFATTENLLEACSPKTSGVDKNIKKPFDRSRQQIISDCRQLLEEIFKKCPQPVTLKLGSFKPLFYERYGYVLDYQMAGYPKLVSLLQTIPGVKVENNVIYPDIKVTKTDSKGELLHSVLESTSQNGSEASYMSRRINDVNVSTDTESVWEELGPVSKTGASANGADCGGNGARIPEVDHQVNFKNESLFSDEDFSDSEDDNLVLVGNEGEGKGQTQEDSSLLQILDSWYRSKDGKENRETEDHCWNNSMKPMDSESADSKNYHCQTKKKLSLVTSNDEIPNVSLLTDHKKSGETKLPT
ncbi:uncharacterized protein [Aristolochia californica]|uniref:uncharacterized protein n=1 Tax=Aristolochia californica TaxID=171875 RepID=UPI0035D768AD